MRVVFIISTSVFLLFSCKKEDKKNPISFSIRATLPAIGDGLKGVKYKVVETYYKSGMFSVWGEDEVTGWELTGETDKYGKADVTFLPKKNAGYYYTIYFDYSSIVVPTGYGENTVIGPSYDHINKGDDSDNQYDIRVLPFMQIQFNFKNLNCINENDNFKYKKINFDENPNEIFSSSAPWIEGEILSGCVNEEGVFTKRLAGHYVFKWEALRGGILETGIDTFFVHPGINDKINVFW